MVAKGETPTWDSDGKKWVSGASNGEDTFVGKKQTVVAPIEDPQEDEEADENLPF
jgi:hypothetical protein